MKRHSSFYLPLAVLLLAALSACNTFNTSPTPGQTETLIVYNWTEYIDPELLDEFESMYNVKVEYLNYESNEEMLAAAQARKDEIDIVVPTDYMVAHMRVEGLLAQLERQLLPNFTNLDARLLNSDYDPHNMYCVPYLWGTTGIAYNIKTTGREITSWKEFFSPEFAGRIALLDDERMVLGAALLYLGYNPNTLNSGEIAAARDFLKSQAQNILAYYPDTDELVDQGEAALVYSWSGEIAFIAQDNPDLHYVIPEEGGIMWVDNLCILGSSKQYGLAHQYINYMLDPQVAARNANYLRYPTPNLKALSEINAADTRDLALYPSAETYNRLHIIERMGQHVSRLYSQAWSDVISHYATVHPDD